MVVDWSVVSPIVGLLTFVGVIIAGIVNKLSSDKIANNHLAHIAEDLKEIKNEQKKHGETISEVKVDIAYLKGKDAVTDKIVKYLREKQ